MNQREVRWKYVVHSLTPIKKNYKYKNGSKLIKEQITQIHCPKNQQNVELDECITTNLVQNKDAIERRELPKRNKSNSTSS